MREAAAHSPFANSVPIENFLRWMFNQWRAWKLFQLSADPVVTYSLFLRMRADLFFQRFDLPEFLGPNGVYVPWWGNYGGCNDRCALITSEWAASTYFQVYDGIDAAIAAGAPCHPESLLSAVLELAQVPIYRTLPAEFVTRRAAGDPRPPAFPVYYAGDIFRYVEVRLAQQLHAAGFGSRP